MAAPGLPWGDWLAFGLGRLRLSPEAFWSLTLPELRAAAEGVFGPAIAPPSRAALTALMRRFPDPPAFPEPPHDPLP